MLYKEYLNAARKHRIACRALSKAIAGLDTKQPVQANEYRALTISLYYLAGYVIECSVKYGIYAVIGYDRRKAIKQLNQNGLSYAEHIRHHKFECYAGHLGRVASEIVLIGTQKGIAREVIQLYRNWDAEIRYYGKDLPEQNKHAANFAFVGQFHQYADEIFESVQQL